jgi:monoamine oxidase
LARSLGSLVTYDAEVLRLRRNKDEGARVEWRDKRTGASSSLDSDYVLVTIQPGLLPQLDHDFSPRVRQALAAPEGTPLAKVGFQAKRRFWEHDLQIYGGISWTDHGITQIWYPSQGIHGQRGILVGAYIWREGEQFANKSLRERIAFALEGGELLHPGYGRQVEHGVSIAWSKVRYSSGATTHWTDETRRDEYPVLLEPHGPYYFAGEYLSYVNGWQEGAVQSAHFTINRLVAHARTRAHHKGSTV